jgi:hypothetical protein
MSGAQGSYPPILYPLQPQVSSFGGQSVVGGGGSVGLMQGFDQSSISRMLRDHTDRDEALNRYRLKRKTRHFEKTIRYATRQVQF